MLDGHIRVDGCTMIHHAFSAVPSSLPVIVATSKKRITFLEEKDLSLVEIRAELAYTVESVTGSRSQGLVYYDSQWWSSPLVEGNHINTVIATSDLVN